MSDCIKCSKSIPAGAPFCPWCGTSQTVQKKKPVRKRGNGTGTAIKRGRTWTARVVLGYTAAPDGTLRAKYATKGGFRTKADALAYCPSLFMSRPETSPTLMHYWNVYERTDLPKLSDSKQQAYEIAWRKIEKLHHIKMDVFDVSVLRTEVDKVASSYYTVRDIKVLLTHLFRLAAADGYANKDLPSFINLPKLNETKREPFTPDEQASLWRAYESGTPYVDYVLLMIYTGMMPGEVLNMTVDMVDLENKVIRGAGKKTSVRKSSPVVLPDCILPLLSSMIEGKNGKVFPLHEKNFYSHYYDALSLAGVRKLPPYSCRHTTATALAITENIAPQTVQKVMRWSTTRMLDRYAHPDMQDARAAVNTLKK